MFDKVENFEFIAFQHSGRLTSAAQTKCQALYIPSKLSETTDAQELQKHAAKYLIKNYGNYIKDDDSEVEELKLPPKKVNGKDQTLQMEV